jgi:hypothetical protein
LINRRALLTTAASLAAIGMVRAAAAAPALEEGAPSGRAHDLIIVGAGTAPSAAGRCA